MTKFPDKPLLSGPKRQHYLPRSYIEGFAREGRVSVFDRDKNEFRNQKPDQVCVIGHFYTFNDLEGRKRFELEHLFHVYETKGADAIRKLVTKDELTVDERTDFAIYLAFAVSRTPEHMESIKHLNSGFIKDICKRLFSDIDQVKEQMRSKPDAPATEAELEAEAKAMVDFAQSDLYEVKTNHQWVVGLALQMAFDIAPILAGRNWMVLHRGSDKRSFITSDAPVLLTTMGPRETGFWWSGVGFGCSDALVLFPLNASCLLAVYGDGGGLRHSTVGDDYMRRFNLELARRCHRFIIGRDEELLRSLAKRLNLSETKWEPKFRKF
ncbi:MAG: DUF4238 domain-containing protein [Deltaproteobacteria bacterium]|nr:MAG: DUF4238 domain-containing protein [Deltaproteobacteria bacterium]